MDNEIKIRLKGVGVKPGLIRSKDIAEILESVEDLAIFEALKADSSLKKEDIIVGLYEIEDKSIGLKFKTTMASIVLPVFLSTTQAIESEQFDSLSEQSIKSLQTIVSFTRKYNCEAIFGSSTNDNLAKITANTVIPEPFLIEGESEILGKVIRIGGKKPRAMLELTDGSTLYCDVPEKIAKQLGHMLYALVRFTGIAKWSSRDYELQEFKIMAIDEFRAIDPNEMFGLLANEINHCFSDIEDIPAFVSAMRENGAVL